MSVLIGELKMTEEVWKDIVGYEGRYQISNLGRVKSLIRNIILSYNCNCNGYRYVVLYKNNKPKVKQIHRLVALNFIPNQYNKREVNHIDGNKQNNYVNNLEWVTSSENTLHCYNVLKRDKNNISGVNNHNSKKVLCIETGQVFNSAREASKSINKSRGVEKCASGKCKTCGGYHWRYLLILFCLLISSCCGYKKNNIRIINNCRSTVTTYKDVVECLIMLDEAQRNL